MRRLAVPLGLIALTLLALPGVASAQAPNAFFTGGAEDQAHVLRGPQTFTFAADQPGVPFQCQVDGTNGWNACASPFTADFQVLGWHGVGIRALGEEEAGPTVIRHFKVVSEAPDTLAPEPEPEPDPQPGANPPGGEPPSSPPRPQQRLRHRHRASVPRSGLALANRGVTVRARCSTSCRMSVRLVLSKRAAKRVNVQSPVAVKTYTLGAKKLTTVRVRLDTKPALIFAGAIRPIRGLRAVVRFQPS